MSSGIDYFLIESTKNNEILVCNCDWYEDGSAFASGDNDYANYGLVEKFKTMQELNSFLKTDKGQKWKTCKIEQNLFIESQLIT